MWLSDWTGAPCFLLAWAPSHLFRYLCGGLMIFDKTNLGGIR
jgi:hypothetical protein